MVNLIGDLLKSNQSDFNFSKNEQLSGNGEFVSLFEEMIYANNELKNNYLDNIGQKRDEEYNYSNDEVEIEVVVKSEIDNPDVENDNKNIDEQARLKKIDNNNKKIEPEKKEISSKYRLFLDNLNQEVVNHYNIKNTSKAQNILSVNGESVKRIKLKLSELNLDAQAKIKNILSDLRNGKIDKETSTNLIASVIMNSNFGKKLETGSKKTSLKVDVKILSKNENGNDSKLSSLTTKKITPENVENKIILNKTEQQVNVKSEQGRVVRKKENEGKTLPIKDVFENEIKELKTELILIQKIGNEPNEVNSKSNSVKTILNENRDNIFNQIVKNTKIIQGENLTKFSTMMRPDNIGRMDFHITIKDGKLNGKIILQTQEAMDFFRNNVEELRAVFQKSNVEMGKIDIALAGQNNGDFNQQNKENFHDKETDDNMKIKFNFTNRAINAFENNNLPSGNYSRIAESKVNLFI